MAHYHFPPKVMYFFKLTHWTHLVLTYVHCYKAIYWNMGNLSGTESLKKTYTHTQQPWTAKFIRQGGVKCPPLLEFWQFDTVPILCIWSVTVSSCVQWPCHVQRTLHRSPFVPLALKSLPALEWKCDRDVPVRAEYFSVLFTAVWPVVSLYWLPFTILQKQASDESWV